MLAVFGNIKGPITFDFQEKGTTVNSASYCQHLEQNSPYLSNDPHILQFLYLQSFLWGVSLSRLCLLDIQKDNLISTVL